MTHQESPVESASAADWDAIWQFFNTAFHLPPDDEEKASEARLYEPQRGLLVRDGGQVVAHAAAYSRELTVPGAVLPAAHVSLVAVAATHRRQGLLRRLMTRQLRDVHDAGREAIAVLWASEGRIYPRFGYGLATQRLHLSIDTHEVGPPPPVGPVRVASAASCQAELAELYDRLRPDRPGWSSRDERWWRHLLRNTQSKDGPSEQWAACYAGPDGLEGYATFRTRSNWSDWIPQGEVKVEQVVAATGQAYTALWRFLLTIDLTRTVSYSFAALDEPLQHLVEEPRQLRGRLLDGLWVRLVDVPRALAARRYATDIDTVLEITDDLLPENSGRWRLSAGPTGAECTRTSEPAELACDVRDLGAVFLAGTPLTALAAGRVREVRPGALARASIAFGWHRQPNTQETF